jgi:hypothetical protein
MKPAKIQVTMLVGLLILLFPANAVLAQWSPDNTPISQGSGSERSIVTTTDGLGGAIIAWLDGRSGSSHNVYAQRVDSRGFVLWQLNGIPVWPEVEEQLYLRIVSDGSGGAILFWIDFRNGGRVLFAQRINPQGIVLWDSDGVSIVSMESSVSYDVAADGTGGAYVAWQDYRNARAQVYAQRLDANGHPAWYAGGVLVCEDTTSQQSPLIAKTTSGGLIVAWSSNRDPRAFANFLSQNGVRRWPVEGIGIFSSFFNVSAMSADSQDGAVFFAVKADQWGQRVIAQRLDSSGSPRWGANGVTIDSVHNASVWVTQSVLGASGKSYVGYSARIGHVAGMVAVVDSAGNARVIWNGTLYVGPQQIVACNSGGVFVATMNYGRITVSQVTDSGERLLNGVIATSAVDAPTMVASGPNGAIAAWADARNTGYGPGLYAQYFTSDEPGNTLKVFLRDNGGQLDSLRYGTVAGATDALDAAYGEFEQPPVPPSGVFDVRWVIPNTEGSRRDIRDTLGGVRVQAIYTGRLQAGEGGYPFVIRWNRYTLPTGNFLLRDGPNELSFAVDMKRRDSLVISSPDLSSFQIVYETGSTINLYARDGGGNEDTLQFGTAPGASDGIDANFGEYELPPPPPVGALDARWQITGTQGSMRDIRDTLGGVRQEAIFTGRLQPGLGGYPFVIRWNRHQLPQGGFTLRDSPGATQFLVNMKVQDSLVISNEDLSSFQIVYDGGNTLQGLPQIGWNIVSVPVTVVDRRKRILFPASTSNAFAFAPTGYVTMDSLSTGIGYWLKFPSSDPISVTGNLRHRDTVIVTAGWNMIGTISDTVGVTTIQQNPPTIIASQFFGYSSGYAPTTQLAPLQGYWVKTIAPGTLVLSANDAFDKGCEAPTDVRPDVASITLTDARGASQTLKFGPNESGFENLAWFEMPPLPPEDCFDARYATNRSLETVGRGETKTTPVLLTSATYPIAVHWNAEDLSITSALCIGGKELVMKGSGSTLVMDPRLRIAVKLSGREWLPKEFSLMQNYPNPFNPVTTIRYDLPKDSRVTLKLINILGQEVVTLMDGEEKAGYKSITVDASRYASGTYFYRLQAGEYTAIRKMLLIK